MSSRQRLFGSLCFLLTPAIYSQPLVYVAAYNASTIAVINSATDTVIAQIPTSPYPRAVAVAPGGGKLYFSTGTPGLFVADTSTNTVVASLALDSEPLAIAVAPSGSRAYALYLTYFGPTLAVVDLNNLTVLSTPAVCGAYKMAQAPDGSRLYIVDGATHSVCIYEPSLNAVTGTIALPPNTAATALATDANGSRLYVTYTRTFYDPNATGDHLAVIDLATNSTISVLDTPFGVYDFVLAPDGSRVYVPDSANNALVILDLVSNAAIGKIKLSEQPFQMAISPDGRRIFVSYPYEFGKQVNFLDQTGVVDTVLGRQIDLVVTGSFPMDLTLINVFPPDRVFIDISPNTLANNVNLSGTDQIAVAVLSRPSFDAATIDRSSLAFGRTGVEAPVISCAASLSDVNGDGLPDLICSFDESKTNFRFGDTTGYLTGRTVSGRAFRGFDAVNVKP